MGFATTFAIGQSLSVLNGVSKVEAHKSNTESVFHVSFDVHNSSNSDMEVHCKRQILTEVDSTVNYFCWTQCYSPGTDQSPTPSTILAGTSTSIFSGYYNPTYHDADGKAGSTIIRYVFFDKDNPNDSAYYDVEYRAWGGLTDDREDDDDDIIVEEPFPNPAVDQTIFEFELPNSSGRYGISLYDMLGNVVIADKLVPQDSKYIMNVSALKAGVYFYAIDLDGNKLLTRKLIVSGN